MAGTHARLCPFVCAALGAALLTGCSRPTPAAPPPAPAPADLPGEVAPAAPTLASPSPPTATPAADAPPASPPPGLPSVPYSMTGYEMIAASVGTANYSGYGCLLTPVGCACELPALQQVTFDFRADGTLHYRFEGEGFAETWEMNRVAPNQWEYISAVHSEERGAQIGEGRALLSFTEDGYVFAQMVDFYEQGIVTCPDVTFRRLMSAGDD